MASDLKFKTSITGTVQGNQVIRDVKLDELISGADFVSTLFLSITGKKATPAESKLLNTILVAAFDHGVAPASGFVPRVVVASGNSVLTAMASTLLALGEHHGGAVTNAMKLYQNIISHGENNIDQAVIDLVKDYRAKNKRIPGFGHPVYRDADPRVQMLFSMARREEIDLKYLNLAYSIETQLEYSVGRKLVINIDGAVAALLLTLGFSVDAGNAIFGLARVAGSIAHILEEKEQANGVRRLKDEDIEYQPH